MKTIEWIHNRIRIIDQTKLPLHLNYVTISDLDSLCRSIKSMRIRGAPALGAAAGWGVYLGIKDSKARDGITFNREVRRVANYIGRSRPTARNLFWGLERMMEASQKNRNKSVAMLKKILFKEARQIMEEDQKACLRIGSYGAALINKRDALLTICNAGILATIDYGTALGVVYRALRQGKKMEVFVCETRPMLQGARLTTWELKRHGVDVTLICDSMAASLMAQGKIKKVFTGADRIAANGDAANKIGTYALAVLARAHKIPFYIAAPASTFDLNIKNGRGIPIEQRDKREVTELFFKKPIAGKDIKVFNPAFDVTPHRMISAIITDKGIIRPPYGKNIRKIVT
ncbi:MAG: methylthioribose-1-phosphate isomerase [Omnitrophica WOR_2 bacterium SM23_72]|nr:MAG: methylthioribose-1-phosphate isomerase [Omnitrophica WOR_2 bacterium SM23_72]